MGRQAYDGMDRKAFCACMAVSAYDLEPQAPVAGQKEKRRALAMGRQAYDGMDRKAFCACMAVSA
ncbi:hypothetical protein, partial [Rossellomorea marisflavi]|uniref:hypothetical protein n=1 Tax=Rossellomorea marisflavi TaxID=189381 RepID=UPI0034576890